MIKFYPSAHEHTQKMPDMPDPSAALNMLTEEVVETRGGVLRQEGNCPVLKL